LVPARTQIRLFNLKRTLLDLAGTKIRRRNSFLAHVKIFPENESYAKRQEYSCFLTSFHVRMISYTQRADRFLMVKFVGKPELLVNETFRPFFLPAESNIVLFRLISLK
jgi:hypothetical protein